MSQVLHCPICQRKLQVPESLLGHDVQCPTCASTFVARAAAAVSAPEALPVPASPSASIEPPKAQPADRDGNKEYDSGTVGGVRRRRRADYQAHRGGTVLVFGILGLVIQGPIGLVLGIVAWVMGSTDLAAMRAGRMDPEGESQTNAGRICGIIATVLHGVITLIILAFFCLCVFGMILGAASGPPKRM
jgi:hypothetical protein